MAQVAQNHPNLGDIIGAMSAKRLMRVDWVSESSSKTGRLRQRAFRTLEVE